MKKIIPSILGLSILFTGVSYAQQCESPTLSSYQYLAMNILKANNSKSQKDITKINEILTKYCYDFSPENDIDNPLFFSFSVDVFKILDSKNINYLNIRTKKMQFDIFSNILVSMEKYKDKEFEATNSKHATEKYKSVYPAEAVPLSYAVPDAQYTQVLNELIKKVKGFSPKTDIMGNSPINYVILTNKAEYLEPLLGTYSNGKLSAHNKMRYTPLHMMFSPSLKDKNTIELNNKVLKNMVNMDILKSKIGSNSYYVFMELMKENNPDFYKKVNEKFPNKSPLDLTKIESDKKEIIKKLSEDVDVIKGLSYI